MRAAGMSKEEAKLGTRLVDGIRLGRVKDKLLNDGRGERKQLAGVEIADGRGGHVEQRLGAGFWLGREGRW